MKQFIQHQYPIHFINIPNESIASIGATGCDINNVFAKNMMLAGQYWSNSDAPPLLGGYNPSSTTFDTACSLKMSCLIPFPFQDAFYWDNPIYINLKTYVFGVITIQNPNTTSHTIDLNIFQGNNTYFWKLVVYPSAQTITLQPNTINSFLVFGVINPTYMHGSKLSFNRFANQIYIGAKTINPETTNLRILGFSLYTFIPNAIETNKFGMQCVISGSFISRKTCTPAIRSLEKTFLVTSLTGNGNIGVSDNQNNPYGFSGSIINTTRCLLSPATAYNVIDDIASYFIHPHGYIRKGEDGISHVFVLYSFTVRLSAARTITYGAGVRPATTTGNYTNLTNTSTSISANTTTQVAYLARYSTTENLDYGLSIKPYIATNSATSATIYVNNFTATVIPVLYPESTETYGQLSVIPV